MARKKSILSGLLKPKKKKSPLAALTTPPKKSAANKSSKPSKPLMMKVVGSESTAYEIPRGEREARIYVYDGRALKGTRKGSVFRMNVIRGQVEMKSIYTGMSWCNETNSCITYDGFAVGYLNDGEIYVSRMVDKFGIASIAVRRDGTDSGGWPILVALLPERDWFIETLGARSGGYGLKPGTIEAFIEEGCCEIKAPEDSYSLTVSLVEAPEWSSAKPHLELMLDGILYARVWQSREAFIELVKLVDAGPFECDLSKHTDAYGSLSDRLEIQIK